ncbi:MAG TPA: sce7726 family protein [Hanamia sp.]
MNEIVETYIDDKLVKVLAKEYNPLDYNEQLIHLLSFAYPSVSFDGWEKFKLHQLVNDIVISKHNGEQVLKYYLFKNFYRKKVIGAFEIKVNNSRADFLTINGSTNSFEIKSSLDNLYKLKKQAADYIQAFEYNYLVIDEKHLDNAYELVPKSFGLWSFKNGRKKIYRDATLNKKIDPEIQISLLTKKDLQHCFSEVSGNRRQILKYFTEEEINYRFKLALKSKYSTRWNFLIKNIDLILPVDIQFFFKTNINPKHIYY